MLLPYSSTACHWVRRQPRTLGRVTASSTTAARPRRSRAAHGAPVTGNRRIASAAPTWSDEHEPSTRRIASPGRLGLPAPVTVVRPTPRAVAVERAVTGAG